MWKKRYGLLIISLLLVVSVVYATTYTQNLTETLTLAVSTAQNIGNQIDNLTLSNSLLNNLIKPNDTLTLSNSALQHEQSIIENLFNVKNSGKQNPASCIEYFGIGVNITSNNVVLYSNQNNVSQSICNGSHSIPPTGHVNTIIEQTTVTVYNTQQANKATNLGDATSNTFALFLADAFGTLFVVFMVIWLGSKAELPKSIIVFLLMVVMWPCAILFGYSLWIPLFVDVGGIVAIVGLREND